MSNNASRLLHQSMKLVNAYKTREAEIILRRLLEIQPDNADAWWLLGRSLSLQGRLDENVEAFRRAVKLAPSRSELWETLGVALIRVGELIEGRDAFAEAFELDNSSVSMSEYEFGKLIESQPGNPLLWFGLGVVLDLQGRLDESKVAMLKAERLGLSQALNRKAR
ncbi:MAG: tetratricopeptide repeat protein [Candidatus Thorarchaeota archaeon]